MNDSHSSDTGKEKESINNLSLIPEKVDPGSLADLMALAGIEPRPRNETRVVTEIHIHHTHLSVDGASIRRINDYISLDRIRNELILVNYAGVIRRAGIPKSLAVFLNTLIDSPSNTITKAETIKRNGKWDHYMSKYHVINDAAQCKLVSISNTNSLKLDLTASPLMTFRDWQGNDEEHINKDLSL